jgi:hypothetical protein
VRTVSVTDEIRGARRRPGLYFDQRAACFKGHTLPTACLDRRVIVARTTERGNAAIVALLGMLAQAFAFQL